MADEADVDVVVVGAGPTGLLAAAELALGGVGVQVTERRPEPDPTVKAGSVNVATAEILDRRGLLPALRRAHQQNMQEGGRLAPGLGGGGGGRPVPPPAGGGAAG